MNPQLILGLVSAAGGLVVAGSASVDYLHSYASRAWPSVEGVVVNSKLRIGAKGSYWAEVQYVYEIGGTRRSGSTVRFGPVVESPEDAQEAVGKFKTGSHVAVYFKPDEPSVSVLEPGRLHGDWGYKLGIGLAFACMGVALAFMSRSYLVELRTRLLWTHGPVALLTAAVALYFFWMVAEFVVKGSFEYHTRLNLGHPIEVPFSGDPLLFIALILGQLAFGALAAGWSVESSYHVVRLLYPSLGWPLHLQFRPFRVGYLLFISAVVAWGCYFGVKLLMGRQ